MLFLALLLQTSVPSPQPLPAALPRATRAPVPQATPTLAFCDLEASVQSLPNVIVIVADDWSADDPAPTPRIDALAASGVTFSRFYVNPTCSLTRMSMLFGRYRQEGGIKGT